ncbi:uncharacterized protein LOC142608717 [Castanea sativa]|uniref:uncharacterized protein LOC142608717 n=1 Tax=Castanea sativa TaxID=21020 RepID=UPI003F64D3BA
MNVIVWNCRGPIRPNFVSSVMDLVRDFDPTILIVTKTRVGGSKAKEIIDRLPFDGAIHVDTVGYAKGIWLLWNYDAVEITQLASTEQEIHAIVKVSSSSFSWIISAIYASPRLSERQILWQNLTLVNDLHNMTWIILGDFNEVLSSAEKLGGRPVNAYRAGLFQECLNACGMMDMGLVRPFRFQPRWLSHPDFPNLVRDAWRDSQDPDIAVTSFTASARRWNKDVFGNLFERRKIIEMRLKGVHKSLAKRPTESLLELDRTLRLEHGEVKELINEFWAMKSRLNWRRNRITHLSDNVGNLIVDEREVADYIRSWYVNMYTMEMGESQRRTWDISNWQVKLSEEEGQGLSKVIMNCISTSSIEVLFNGGALEAFNLSRGIRQGDKCMEVILGQKINKDKSRIYFSPNVDAGKREDLCEIMGTRSTPNLGKYLGFPLKQPGSSSQDYNFAIEMVQAKLPGWKGNLLSFAGRIVLA